MLPTEVRTVLPPDWKIVETAPDGAYYKSTDGLAVIVSVATELDGKRWLHVSCSRAERLPSWFDLRRVKNVFVGEDKKAIQVLPPQTEYVNIHPNVLHMFHCLDGDALPDFTQGSGSL